MPRIVNVAEAKKHLSDLLGRVAYRGETFIIARRGKPIAKLVPAEAAGAEHLANVRGWLDNEDKFFEAVASIVKERHQPRIVRRRP